MKRNITEGVRREGQKGTQWETRRAREDEEEEREGEKELKEGKSRDRKKGMAMGTEKR